MKDLSATKFKIPHKMMYWEFSDGSFTVQDETDMLILGYDDSRHLKDQILFRTFEFFSILEDHD